MIDPLAQWHNASTARHEFGHLVVAKRLGFQTGDVSVAPLKAECSVTLQPSLPTFDEVVPYLEKRIQILFAGVAAQSLTKEGQIHSKKATDFLRDSASDDYSKIRELTRLLVGIKYPGVSETEFKQRLDETEKDLTYKAGEIVEADSDVIIALTRYFLKEQDVAGDPHAFTLPAKKIDDFFDLANA